MSRLATSFVLGYHGCDAELARRAVNHGASLLRSDEDYDWLGPGAYFWESDPQRAWEWANAKVERGRYKEPAVLGAVIDLGECLDLLARSNVDLVRDAYADFERTVQASDSIMPRNRNPRGASGPDRLLRYLDCAVIRHLHGLIEDASRAPDATGICAFDTVRGLFQEGGEAFPGSGFALKSHVQIAVRNDACIKGLFFPL